MLTRRNLLQKRFSPSSPGTGLFPVLLTPRKVNVPYRRHELQWRGPLLSVPAAVQNDSEGQAAPTEVAEPPPPAASSPPLATPDLDSEILKISVPTAASLAADTLASLVSTAWVGRLGSEELAAVGVALSVYVAATKLVNTPLMIVSVSIVGEAVGEAEEQRKKAEAEGAAAAAGSAARSAGVGAALSGTIVLALMVGLLEGAALGVGAVPGLELWGAGPSSPLHTEAANYLFIRALTAPIPLLLLTLQSCCRGLGDSETQVKSTVVCNVINIVLEPIFIFALGWGVKGAATAVAVSQLVSCAIVLYNFSRQYPLRLNGGEALKNSLQYLKPTGLVMLRTLAVYSCFATATGIIARTDATHTAAHQVCLQVALAAALLADSLSVAVQALVARATAVNDQRMVQEVGNRGLQLAVGLGALVMAGVAAASPFFPHIFTTDGEVLEVIGQTMPFVVAIQLFYALGFVSDGLMYGAGGYRYMTIAAAVSAAVTLAVMLGGSAAIEHAGGGAGGVMAAVWAGLNTLLAFRFLTVFLPFRQRWGPFEKLVAAGAGGAGATGAVGKDRS